MAKQQAPVPAKPTQEKKAPKKSGRTEFKLVGNKDAKVYPFNVAVPDGFDFKANKVLKKKDFTSDALYFEHRAAELDHKAKGFREQAEWAKAHGTRTDQAKAKRLAKMQEKIMELRKQLESQGVDVEALLAEQQKANAA